MRGWWYTVRGDVDQTNTKAANYVEVQIAIDGHADVIASRGVLGLGRDASRYLRVRALLGHE